MNPKLTYCARSRIHRLHLLPLPRRHHHDDDCVLPALWVLQLPLLENTQKALKHTHKHTECARACVCVSLSLSEKRSNPQQQQQSPSLCDPIDCPTQNPNKKNAPKYAGIQSRSSALEREAQSSSHLNTGKLAVIKYLEPSGLQHIFENILKHSIFYMNFHHFIYLLNCIVLEAQQQQTYQQSYCN
jgi:hypothetical protein